jgi:hypothetical protein
MSSVVNIKNEAKLLKANTLMIELYVFIQNRKNKNLDFNLQKTQNRFLDPIYEKTDEIMIFFDEIYFQRGKAILFYIQAKIQFKVFKKV